MGLVLSMYQIDESAIDPLIAHPYDLDDFMEKEYERSTEAGDPEGYLGASEGYLEEDWLVIDTLITDCRPGLDYLLYGGRPIGDGDHGVIARALPPSEVHAFDAGLTEISVAELRSQYDPEALMRRGFIPPNSPPRDDQDLNYLLEYFADLKEFIHVASARGKGVVVCIS